MLEFSDIHDGFWKVPDLGSSFSNDVQVFREKYEMSVWKKGLLNCSNKNIMFNIIVLKTPGPRRLRMMILNQELFRNHLCMTKFQHTRIRVSETWSLLKNNFFVTKKYVFRTKLNLNKFGRTLAFVCDRFQLNRLSDGGDSSIFRCKFLLDSHGS